MTNRALPTWPVIRGEALDHLAGARNEISEVQNWLRAIDTPLTPAAKAACAEVLRLTSEVKERIDQAKGILHEAGPRG